MKILYCIHHSDCSNGLLANMIEKAKAEGKDYEFKQIKVEEFPQYKNDYDCMIYGLQEKGYLSRIKNDLEGFPCCEVDMTAFATKNPTKVFAQIEAMKK